jgi:hypothetical protein
MKNIYAIGAIGGSGTRAVSQMLMEAGIFMGSDLNKPNDNLIFTRLFKNPAWFYAATEVQILERLELFENLMEKRKKSIKDLYDYLQISLNNDYHKTTTKNIIQIILEHFKLGINNGYQSWGWKEPNTHIYLNYVAKYFTNIKYIHVIRHGLDMAYSGNKEQLFNWGYLYNIKAKKNDSAKDLAAKQLEYWIKTNKDVIKRGQALLGKNFYICNHTKLCENPSDEVNRLVNYLDIPINNETIQKIVNIPKTPSSNNRYKNMGFSSFSSKQLNEVEKLGFIIES